MCSSLILIWITLNSNDFFRDPCFLNFISCFKILRHVGNHLKMEIIMSNLMLKCGVVYGEQCISSIWIELEDNWNGLDDNSDIEL